MSRTAFKLATVAIAATLLTAQPAAASFNLSFVQNLLDDLGVDVDVPEIDLDLPPRAEEAVQRALDRAESALDRVFGEDGILDGVDLPDSVPTIPDVDQIVADAQARAQEAIDSALGRAESVLDDLDIDLPDSVQDILDGIDLPDTTPDVSLPDVTEIIEDALDGVDAGGVVEDVLDSIGGQVGDVIDEVLDSEDPVSTILSNLPLDGLPEPALLAIESALNRLPPLPLPAQAAAIPEPTSAALLAGMLLAGTVGRRQKVSE